jgi:hypothetical protein
MYLEIVIKKLSNPQKRVIKGLRNSALLSTISSSEALVIVFDELYWTLSLHF